MAAHTTLTLSAAGAVHTLHLPLPTCALCRRPVHALRAHEGRGADVLLTAVCHGQVEVVRAPRALLLAPEALIQVGTAFAATQARDSRRAPDAGHARWRANP